MLHCGIIGSSALLTEENPLASMPPDELKSSMTKLGDKTQAELAAAIGVSRSAVSLWLEGKVGVPRPIAMLLRMLVAAQRRAY
jgi:plasmid maintenance system antidote protein VapI